MLGKLQHLALTIGRSSIIIIHLQNSFHIQHAMIIAAKIPILYIILVSDFEYAFKMFSKALDVILPKKRSA
jgi:hypothetical protein